MALARKLGIAESDKFNLLNAVGGDCAGAVSLYPEGQIPLVPEEYEYERFAPELLQKKFR